MTQTQTTTQTNGGPRSGEQLYTPELQQSYAKNGYIIFKNVVSPEKLAHLHARILEEFDRAKQSGSLFAGGGTISGHINCYPGEEARAIYEELEQHGIIDVVKAMSSKVTRLPYAGCNLNLPGSVAQHYHVDGTYTGAFMIVNVAVVDTDLANGAIDLLPGTHKRYYKFWQYALKRLYRRTTRVPMKQGDVLIRTSTVWHRGMPNHTAVARPMLAFTWEGGGNPAEDPFKVDGGKIAFRQNWYRSGFVGRLRERTFIAAPISYSAYRFVRSLYGNKGY
jgi:ectoine hydroxylase-related dioxygenase (phytanoyl-CoA dioxygenase family)